ncbi:MAG: hypothetical protein WBV73_27075 [Phormidium sp.]
MFWENCYSLSSLFSSRFSQLLSEQVWLMWFDKKARSHLQKNCDRAIPVSF